jgi:hypothetical protein
MANLATITTNILADSGIDDINVIVSTGSYADPAWITSLAWTKITGAPANIVTGTGTTNYLPKFTGASTIGNSQIFDNGSQVGINETSPSEGRLVVNNPSGSTNNGVSGNTLYLKAQTANANLIRFSGAIATDLIIGRFGNADNFSIGTTGGSTIVTFTSSGNLGIGSTTPSVRLYVQNSSVENPTLFILEGSNTGRGLEIKLGADGLGANGSAVIYNTRVGSPYGEHIWQQAGTQRMRLDTSGNLGLGVTPSAWNTVTAFQVGSTSLGGYSNTGYVNSNAFYQTGWKYINSSYAARYEINSSDAGIHAWYTAPSGTAGNAISFTQAMTLGSNSGLSIGTPSAAPAQGLLVQGASTFSSQVGFGTGLYIDTNGDLYQPVTGRVFISAAAANVTFPSYGFYNDTGLGMYRESTDTLAFATSGVKALTLASNQAATFSSSVTAGGNVSVLNATSAPVNGESLPEAFFLEGRGWNTSVGSVAIQGRINLAAAYESASGSTEPALVFSLKGSGGGAVIPAGPSSLTERMRITNAGNVGIGTASPATNLQVSSTNSIIRISNTTLGLSNADLDLGVTSTGLTRVWQYGNYAMVFATDNTERMRITSGGNVGIGTTSPGAALDVNGNGNTLVANFNYTSNGTYVRWQNNGTSFGDVGSAGSLVSGGATNDFAIHARSGNMVFSMGFTERMRITSGGNVGIGTSSPSVKLDVVGKVRSTNTSNSAVYSQLDYDGVYTFGTNLYLYADTGFNTYFYAGGTEKMRLTSGGSLGIGTTSPSSQLAVFLPSTTGGGISLQALGGATYARFGIVNPGTDNTGYIGSTSNNPFLFYTVNTERMRISETGNVGIGTTSPSGKFQVVLTPYLSEDTDSQQAIFGSGTSGYGVRIGYNESNNIGYINSLKPGVAWSNLQIQANNIIFAPVATERMRITSGGDVGIGTSSPSAKLEIVGSSGGLSLKLPSGIWYGASTSNRMAFDNPNQLFHTSLSSGAYKFRNSADNADVMTILNAGNVGIGTDSPLNRLFVTAATAGDYAGFIENTNSTNGYGLVARTAHTGTSSYAFAARAGTTDVFIVRGDGRVGIGTTSPAALLDVNGIIRNNGSNVNLIKAGTSGITAINFGDASSGDVGQIYYDHDSNFMRVGVNDAERMRITSSGDLLIGDTTASANLWVKSSASGNTFGARNTNATFAATVGFFGADRNTSNNSFYYIDCYNYGNSTYRFRVADSGNVTSAGSVTATSFFESSDKRLKSNIIDLDVNVSSIIAKSYLKNGVEEIGYIAQDVENILPSAVSIRDNGYLDLSYRQIHTAKIAALEKEVAELKKQLNNK